MTEADMRRIRLVTEIEIYEGSFAGLLREAGKAPASERVAMRHSVLLATGLALIARALLDVSDSIDTYDPKR